jgi:hypothetical protein
MCVQSWDAAGAGQNADDRNFLGWALSLIMDLLFPGKKPKDVIEDGQADNIDPGKKKKDDNVKVLNGMALKFSVNHMQVENISMSEWKARKLKNKLWFSV